MKLIISNPEQIERLVFTAVQEAINQAELSAPQPEKSSWLSNSQAMELLQLSVATLARMRASGVLPYSKVGKSVYYRREDVENLLLSNLSVAEGRRDPDEV